MVPARGDAAYQHARAQVDGSERGHLSCLIAPGVDIAPAELAALVVAPTLDELRVENGATV